MLKSLYAHFDSDKLYVVKPTVVALDENENTVLKTLDDEIDIAFINETGAYGLIKKRKYLNISKGIFDLKAYYLYDDNKIPLVKYLFETTYGKEYTDEMFELVKNTKKYYEIEELAILYPKLVDNEQKNKCLRK